MAKSFTPERLALSPLAACDGRGAQSGKHLVETATRCAQDEEMRRFNVPGRGCFIAYKPNHYCFIRSVNDGS
jgi:hypothetical protein